MGVSYSAFVILNLLFPRTPAYIHQFLAIFPATLVNYFLNSYWTFKARPADATEKISPQRHRGERGEKG